MRFQDKIFRPALFFCFPAFFVGALVGSLWKLSSSGEKRASHTIEESVAAFEEWSVQQRNRYALAERKHLFLLEKNPFYKEEECKKEIQAAIPGWIFYKPSAAGSCVVWTKTLLPVRRGSAVLVGDCVVGYIDRVQGLSARIRLVTDTRSQIAVTVQKSPGEEAEGWLRSIGQDLAYWKMLAQEKLPKSDRLLGPLETLEKAVEAALPVGSENLYGLVRGVTTAWRYSKNELLGRDFYQEKSGEKAIAPGDLLVTSGLDGRYLPGLRVGYVTRVTPQDPAKTLFEVGARWILADFSHNRWVWIFPMGSQSVGTDLPE